jgi:hypothetical protein
MYLTTDIGVVACGSLSLPGGCLRFDQQTFLGELDKIFPNV